ncbi:unnamed protein product [Alternaria sp. RS040]
MAENSPQSKKSQLSGDKPLTKHYDWADEDPDPLPVVREHITDRWDDIVGDEHDDLTDVLPYLREERIRTLRDSSPQEVSAESDNGLPEHGYLRIIDAMHRTFQRDHALHDDY